MKSAAGIRPGRLVYLHIGKTAGTQVALVSQQLARHGIQIELLSHGTKLKKIASGVPYFFSIRDPLSRFMSGFYSRKRKGQPRYNIAWSPYEVYAFGLFEHANDLAESLLRNDALGRAATRAITAIRHTAMHQIEWFECVLNFDLRPPVWIIRQERFAEDLAVLLDRLDVPGGLDAVRISTDPRLAHENDYTGVPGLSELARRNLRSWYARDFAFHDLCLDWLNRNAET